MQFSEDNNNALFQIKSYDDHSITVNDQRLETAFFLMHNKLQQLQSANIDQLNPVELANLLQLSQIDILIIGSKEQRYTIPALLTKLFIELKIGFETMQPHAACRSYTALQAEGRSVATIIFPL